MVSKKSAAALRAAVHAGAFALLAVAAGCGGGGGGSEADTASTQTIENADYYPLHVGDRRSYRTSYAGGDFGDSTVYFAEIVTGTRDVDGATHFVVHTEDFFPRNALMTAGATVVQVRSSTDPTAWHRDLLRFPATLGVPFVQEDKPYAVEDRDGDGASDTSITQYVTTPIDLSTLQTPAGRFERTLHVRTDTITTILRSSDGATQTEATWSVDHWYAPGVGVVRTLRTSDDGQTTTELLTSQPAAQPRRDATAPTLLAITPAAGITTHRGTSLQLTFDEPVSAYSVRGAVTVTDSRGERNDLFGALSDKTGRRVVLHPMAWPGGTYTVHIAPGITDLTGNPMGAQPDHTFVVDDTVPAAINAKPSPQAENVTQYNGVLTANFSLWMDPATFNAITLREGSVAVPATVKLEYGQLTVTPATPLKPLTRYTVDLTGLKGEDGVPLANPVDWTFVTGTTVVVKPPGGATSAASAAPLRSAPEATGSAAVLRAGRTQ